jgi:hypothetical protein
MYLLPSWYLALHTRNNAYLTGCGDGDGGAFGKGDGYGNGHSDCHSDGNGHSDGYGHGDGYGLGYSDGDGNGDGGGDGGGNGTGYAYNDIISEKGQSLVILCPEVTHLLCPAAGRMAGVVAAHIHPDVVKAYAGTTVDVETLHAMLELSLALSRGS